MKDLIKKFIPSFLINFYHFSLAFLGALIYWFPAKKLKVIGVTGTNGKSTVIEMISKIFEEASFKVASFSSIRFKIKEKIWPNTLRMTMPGRFQVQKLLREAVNSGCQYAVLEVTSEGIKQYRHKFINFETAAFTNLSLEHIEAHGSFEKYQKAKGKLFEATKNIHVINIDDENAEYFLQFLAKKKYTYGLNKGDINAKNTQFKLRLMGEFNIYNALAAICVGLSQNIPLETCKKALEKIEGIPGRMELIISEPFKVFVDYAFTPNALEKVYQTISNQQLVINNKLICVLGSCGGGRDKWKRPVLGELAAKYCDEIIVTNEDPYDENPMEIIEQVAQGTQGKAKKILERKEAIKEALKLAKENDTIIITGKGCEPSICVGRGKKILWDDRQVVREEFQKLKMKNEKLKFEVLEHKADLKIRAFGKTKKELFTNVLLAMSESQKGENLSPKVKREIQIKSLDLETLLVDFLSEVLYLSQVNKEIYNEVKFKKFSDTELEAELVGQKVERFGEDIKAVTYHGLEICQRKDGTWEITILFDI